MIQSSIFGKTADGRNVMAFRIRDGINEAVILSMGGIIQSLRVADKRGYPVDVVLGYNDVASYERHPEYIGGIIGRCANRIENGRMCIDGITVIICTADRSVLIKNFGIMSLKAGTEIHWP